MGIAADQVRVRNSMIADSSELLWQAVQRLIADGISRGYLEERPQYSACACFGRFDLIATHPSLAARRCRPPTPPATNQTGGPAGSQ
jgi:hypothetical protein